MAIDPQRERLVLLSQGRQLSPPTSERSLWRWARKGLKDGHGKRVRLETFRHGGIVYTSHEAFTRFCEALKNGRD
jgi:hypothetical protein